MFVWGKQVVVQHSKLLWVREQHETGNDANQQHIWVLCQQLIGWLSKADWLVVKSWLVGCQKLIGCLSKADWLLANSWLIVNSWLVGCQQLIGWLSTVHWFCYSNILLNYRSFISMKQATSNKNLLCRYFIDVRQLLSITKCQQKSSYCTNNNNKVMSLTEAKLTSC